MVKYANLFNAVVAMCQRTNATFKKSNATLLPVPVCGQVWHTVGDKSMNS